MSVKFRCKYTSVYGCKEGCVSERVSVSVSVRVRGVYKGYRLLPHIVRCS